MKNIAEFIPRWCFITIIYPMVALLSPIGAMRYVYDRILNCILGKKHSDKLLACTMRTGFWAGVMLSILTLKIIAQFSKKDIE